MALAYLELKDAECAGCGGDLNETTREGRFADLYEAEPVQCKRCAAREQAAATRSDLMAGSPDYGLLWETREKT